MSESTDGCRECGNTDRVLRGRVCGPCADAAHKVLDTIVLDGTAETSARFDAALAVVNSWRDGWRASDRISWMRHNTNSARAEGEGGGND